MDFYPSRPPERLKGSKVQGSNIENDELMENNYRFRLKPYKVPSDRTDCPNCHHRRCFVPYIDTEGSISFPPYVGRCNRENNCGYHYPPKQFFRDHPETKGELDVSPIPSFVPAPPKPQVEPYYFPASMMEQSMRYYHKNNFYLFLKSRFGENAAKDMMSRFHIGTAMNKKGSCAFWQVDVEGRIRDAKVMLYNADNGHRIKEVAPTWAHTLTGIPHERIHQCFFGEHLLPAHPDLPVGIVESEKTVVIASYHLPKFVWLATGGSGGMFGKANLEILKGRKVMLFPDLGQMANWQGKACQMRLQGIDASVYDYLEKHVTKEEKEKGLDIADYLLNEPSQVITLRLMVDRKPCLQVLIDKLKLEIVDNA